MYVEVDSILKNGAWQRTKEVANFSSLQDQSSASVPLYIICNSVETFEATKKMLLLLYAALRRSWVIRSSGKSVAN